MTDHEIFDIIVIGYGPVGQTLSALLGKSGLKVGIFERQAGVYPLPRACVVDDEIVRIFQHIGVAHTFVEDAIGGKDFGEGRYAWVNHHREPLMIFDWGQPGISGWAAHYLFYQPYLEVALDRAGVASPNVSLHRGWEASAISQTSDGVEVALRRFPQPANAGEDDVRLVRAKYLIGADGANSTVRRALGLDYRSLGFDEEWLVVDLKLKRDLPIEVGGLEVAGAQICDPARPFMTAQMGRSHRRFEFMKMPGDTSEYLGKPETAWELIGPWLSENDAELIRNTLYRFRSAFLDEWRVGRILLAGDAAHLMPPFMGQGMCSGMRDAANLAWKLDLVLKERADDALLDSYQSERSPHVGAFIDLSMHVGRISCTIDPQQAVARDAAFKSGVAPPPPTIPGIDQGLIHGGQAAPGDIVTGKLGVQGRIRLDGRTGLADDLIDGYNRWQMISCRSAKAALSAEALAFADELGLAFLSLDTAEDIDGAYAGYFDSRDVEAILVRPDFYVYGGVKDVRNVNDLLLDLRSRIGWKA